MHTDTPHAHIQQLSVGLAPHPDCKPPENILVWIRRVYKSINFNFNCVMTSSLLIKILKIDKFGDFSFDIDYNSRTDACRDVLCVIINQYYSRRP